MDLLNILEEYRKLEKEANLLAGTEHCLPLSAVEGPKFFGHVMCKVTKVDLAENMVELSYIDREDGEEMLTFVSIETFVELTTEKSAK